LLDRRPLGTELASLFLFANPSQRTEILLAAQRKHLNHPARSPPLLPALINLEAAAVACRADQFISILAEALDCEPVLARRIADDEFGEPLALALLSLGASYDLLVRVLISNDLMFGTNYRRIRALARLHNTLNRNAAGLIVAALRDHHPTSRWHTKRNDRTVQAALARQTAATLNALGNPEFSGEKHSDSIQ
jgi:hypothetical protein